MVESNRTGTVTASAGDTTRRRERRLPGPFAGIVKAAWILFVVSGVAAFAFGHYNELRTTHSIKAVLLIMSLLLVGISFTWWRAAGAATHWASYTACLFFGMLAGCLGDFILASSILKPQRVISGMA